MPRISQYPIFLLFIFGVAIKFYSFGVYSALGPPNPVRKEGGTAISSPPKKLCHTVIESASFSSHWIGEKETLQIEAIVRNEMDWLDEFDSVIEEYLADTADRPSRRTGVKFQEYLHYFISDYHNLGISNFVSRPNRFGEDLVDGCPSLSFDQCLSLIKKIAVGKSSFCPPDVHWFGNFNIKPLFDTSDSIRSGESKVFRWNAEPQRIGRQALRANNQVWEVLVTKYPGIPTWLAFWGSSILIFLGPAATLPWLLKTFCKPKVNRKKL